MIAEYGTNGLRVLPLTPSPSPALGRGEPSLSVNHQNKARKGVTITCNARGDSAFVIRASSFVIFNSHNFHLGNDRNS